MKEHLWQVSDLFEMLFTRFCTDLREGKKESVIFTHFLKEMAPAYLDQHRPEEIVRDFIAGMTDRYFIRQCPERMRPKTVVID